MTGSGNSAGQAAVFLAQTAGRVHMLVRSGGLAESMSRYLIRRINESPAIVLGTRSQIVALEESGHLERVRWLDGCVALDAKGFIKTGPDLSRDDLAAGRWPLARSPYFLAAGDVRAGWRKRVASAVGEGSKRPPSSTRSCASEPPRASDAGSSMSEWS